MQSAFSARQFVLVVGDCKVDYEGRASSVLDWGERVTMVKEDGSVLVHRPSGYEPVNWQPPKCLVTVRLADDGGLVLNAARSQPRETVMVEFRDISLAAAGHLDDTGEFSLHVTEEQMKEALLIAPELIEKGLKPLLQEKSLGDAGFTDIYAEDRNGNLVVIEIKRNAASKDAIMQLQRYIDTISKRVSKPIRGVVVAPELRKSAQPLLDTLKLEYVRLSPEKCFKVLKGGKEVKLSHFLSDTS